MREEQIGDCQLILGDCRDVISGLKFDAICADPPYGIAYSPGSGGGIRDKNGKRYGKVFSGDNLVIGDSEPFDPAFILTCGVPTILWGANHYASRLPDMDSWLIWDKRRGILTNDFADCEMAWTNIGGPARLFSHLWNGMFRDSERGEKRVHPTQKSIEVMKWCLGFIPDAKITLDCFMGGGTTLVALAKLGRAGIGIELDETYFDIACKRIEEAYRQPDLFIEPPVKHVQEKLI